MSVVLILLVLVVLMMAFGFGLLGFALSVAWSLIWYAVVGLVIGSLGRAVVSGNRSLSVLSTILIGIVGALLGGIIANDVLDVGWFGQFLTAVIVAAVLVVVLAGRRSLRSPPSSSAGSTSRLWSAPVPPLRR